MASDTAALQDPTTVCTVVFHPNGSILSVSRKDDPNALGLPGGKVDPGESLEEAAIRETKEETGVDITDMVPIFTGKSRVTVCRCFLVKKFEGEPIQPKNEGRVKWVSPLEILNGPFRNYNTEVLLILSSMGYPVFSNGPLNG